MDHTAIAEVGSRGGDHMRYPAFHIIERNNARCIVDKDGGRVAIIPFENGFKTATFHAICPNDLLFRKW